MDDPDKPAGIGIGGWILLGWVAVGLLAWGAVELLGWVREVF